MSIYFHHEVQALVNKHEIETLSHAEKHKWFLADLIQAHINKNWDGMQDYFAENIHRMAPILLERARSIPDTNQDTEITIDAAAGKIFFGGVKEYALKCFEDSWCNTDWDEVVPASRAMAPPPTTRQIIAKSQAEKVQ